MSKNHVCIYGEGSFHLSTIPVCTIPMLCVLWRSTFYDLVWETIYRLESVSVKVVALTADGASTNRLLSYCSEITSGVNPIPILYTWSKVFLSERLCQDPLERFFGCQRQRGGNHKNPTVQEFYKNTQALRVINSFCVGTMKGNCRGRLEAQDVEDENSSLPMRSKSCK